MQGELNVSTCQLILLKIIPIQLFKILFSPNDVPPVTGYYG